MDIQAVKKLFYDTGIIAFCSKQDFVYIDGCGDKLVIYYKEVVPLKDIQSIFNEAEQLYSLISRK